MTPPLPENLTKSGSEPRSRNSRTKPTEYRVVVVLIFCPVADKSALSHLFRPVMALVSLLLAWSLSAGEVATNIRSQCVPDALTRFAWAADRGGLAVVVLPVNGFGERAD